jgi:hypothetical protein
MAGRGLVLLPSLTFNSNGYCFVSVSPKHFIEQARSNLPYWDRISFASHNPFATFYPPPELNPLVAEGVVVQSPRPRRNNNKKLAISNQTLLEDYVAAQIDVWRQHEALEPGYWAIGQAVPDLVLPQGQTVDGRIALVTLHNLLPVPGDDVPLETVLDFKRKRNPELQTLRQRLDDLYQTVASSGDPAHALVAACDRLKVSLEEVHRVAGESWQKRLLSTVKVNLDVSKVWGGAKKGVATGAVSGAALSGYWQSPITVPLLCAIGGAIGAVPGIIKIEGLKTAILRDTPEHLRDYAYAYQVHRELRK